MCCQCEILISAVINVPLSLQWRKHRSKHWHPLLDVGKEKTSTGFSDLMDGINKVAIQVLLHRIEND